MAVWPRSTAAKPLLRRRPLAHSPESRAESQLEQDGYLLRTRLPRLRREHRTEGAGGKLDFLRSDRDYDWLGPGVYFWESDPVRALDWAREKAARGSYEKPFVIGAIIDLGNCLDLLVREDMEWLEVAYRSLVASHATSGQEMPQNKDLKADKTRDKLLRYLDCAVIRRLHSILEEPLGDDPPPADRPLPFDTVRGLFTEGDPIYPGSGFYLKTHTQIAVRAENCIKGVFLPR